MPLTVCNIVMLQVFLDLPSPVVSIDAAISLVKPGKCILMYTPRYC